ncbi:hypothetical protein DRN44_00195 [Thermococci archaeon]|nr:MAG: hypothetical protein DRN44_00195 [Thermococci archaeon]
MKNIRKKFAVVLVLLVSLSYLNVVSGESYNETPTHEPIIIIGDDNFTSENGVIGGSGTKEDPYIIENWVIKANETAPYDMGTVGIFIANTTKYFVIRNVTVFGGDWGILLDNVSNFVIEDSKFYDINWYAIVAGGVIQGSLAFNGTIRNNEAWNIGSFVYAEGSNFLVESNYAHDLEAKSGSGVIGIEIVSNDSLIRDNIIENINGRQKSYADGILVILSAENVTIQNNTIHNIYNITYGEGITLYTTNANSTLDKIQIIGNYINNISDNGIDIDGHNGGIINHVIVANNTVNNCYWRSVLVYYTHGNITIANNTLSDNEHHGIGIEHSSNITVMDNEIYGSKNRGIYILNSTAIHIVGNNIHDNPEGIRIEEGSGDAYLESNWLHSNNHAILIFDSPNATMKSNTLENNSYNLGIWAGTNVEGYLHHIDTSNTIDGRPIYYWVGVENEGIPQNASFVGLINCRNITGENLQLEHEGRILIVNSTGVAIENSVLQNNEFAMDIVLSKDVIFKNVSILDTDKTAVSVFSSVNVTLTNITVASAGLDGGYFNDVCNSSILNSEISNASNGINLHYSTHNTIQNNSIHHNSDRGIALWDFSEDNVIENNDVYSNGNIGISLDAGNNTVEANKVRDNEEDGIISANANGNQIIRNEIYGNLAGVRFWNSNYTLISTNEIYDNRENGISSDNSFNAVIQNNTAYGNQENGIGFWRSGNFSVVGNTVHENGFAGIVSGHGSNATLRDNVIFQNNASGIEIWEGSQVKIFNATVYRNAHAGIVVIHPGTFAWIENSTVYENTWRGIEFHDGGYGTVKSSRIFNNSIDGIYILNTSSVTIIESNISNNNACGIAADYSSNIVISESVILKNSGGSGIGLDSVTDFVITGSNIEGDVSYPPIAIDNSINGLIYMNDIKIINDPVHIKNSTVQWNSPAPLKYLYNDQNFTSYLGNYWDNYNGTDENGDGIGDTPWIIDSVNKDEYPLIEPHEKYEVILEKNPPHVNIISPIGKIYNTTTIPIKLNITDESAIEEVTTFLNEKQIGLIYNSTSGLYENTTIAFTNGSYVLNVYAKDAYGNLGSAEIYFVVYINAEVKEVQVNNETSVTIGTFGGIANVTAENNTIIANVSTSTGIVHVEVPIVNNISSVVVNVTAVTEVASGESNVSLVAGWGSRIVSYDVQKTKLGTENNKETYAVTLKANVTLGENGVAVVALRDINISTVYIWKNSQKIELTTDRSNSLGYYYKEGSMVFVVLKKDPVIEAKGYFEITLPPTKKEKRRGSIVALNFLGYRWYNKYLKEFEELYTKALEMNVSNETLQLALQYNETASKYYQKALELSNGNIILHLGDVRILAPLRKAYLNEIKAVEILREALEKLEIQGS